MILALVFIAPFLYTSFFFKTEHKRTNMAIKSMRHEEKEAAEPTANSEERI